MKSDKQRVIAITGASAGVGRATVQAFAKERARIGWIARFTEVNYLGYVYGTLAAMKHMLPRNHGRIIQVGSALAYRGIPRQSAYCASRHAIQGFVDSLRCELLHDRSDVKACMLQIPAMNTPQFGWVRSRRQNKAQPVEPIYEPEVSADAICHRLRVSSRPLPARPRRPWRSRDIRKPYPEAEPSVVGLETPRIARTRSPLPGRNCLRLPRRKEAITPLSNERSITPRES